MVTRKKWTKEEEEILVQAIAANPHNITEACKNASNQLESRSFNACVFHWYQVLAPANNPAKVGVTFMTISSKHVFRNRKNKGKVTPTLEKNILWTKIKKVLGLK